jgi:cytochrome b561
VLIGMSTAETNQQITELDSLGSWAFVIAMFGLMLFLAGVGLSGWIRSTATGIATSFFALMTLCLCIWAFLIAASAIA